MQRAALKSLLRLNIPKRNLLRRHVTDTHATSLWKCAVTDQRSRVSCCEGTSICRGHGVEVEQHLGGIAFGPSSTEGSYQQTARP